MMRMSFSRTLRDMAKGNRQRSFLWATTPSGTNTQPTPGLFGGRTR